MEDDIIEFVPLLGFQRHRIYFDHARELQVKEEMTTDLDTSTFPMLYPTLQLLLSAFLTKRAVNQVIQTALLMFNARNTLWRAGYLLLAAGIGGVVDEPLADTISPTQLMIIQSQNVAANILY
ncbi:hypothetical protein N7462_009480 [Penicillium macrosclerotiorum]|uniref:uncharacterized protein n=1 Tax=Penicillium macrosclerotiorum TaxID=303699 RepID=UPI0025475FFE|nr:uncharacterized protein N7462_009480 [Penicillium macrosclerotiorum]KAJ5674041.1 hypothetical protein N7462_009480 [Penicillium macrosclerotiorum]